MLALWVGLLDMFFPIDKQATEVGSDVWPGQAVNGETRRRENGKSRSDRQVASGSSMYPCRGVDHGSHGLGR